MINLSMFWRALYTTLVFNILFSLCAPSEYQDSAVIFIRYAIPCGENSVVQTDFVSWATVKILLLLQEDKRLKNIGVVRLPIS